MDNVSLFLQSLLWLLIYVGVPLVVIYFLFIVNEIPLGATVRNYRHERKS